MKAFGKHIKSLRENLYKNDKSFSLRGLAKARIQPSYLSKIEEAFNSLLVKNLLKDYLNP